MSLSFDSQQARICVGPAGWSYDDWKGIVYPNTSLDRLAWIADHFDLVEVNSSFYRTPPRRNAESWVHRTERNPDFLFTTKLFRGFTHERESMPQSEVDAFRSFLEPLRDAGKLGAVLLQFPWSFRATKRARDRLSELAELFSGYPLVAEVRHGSFMIDRFFDFLQEKEIGFVNIDQPQIGESIPPTEIVTSSVGYVRLHGRNREKWIEHDEPWERYDYLYSREELSPWVDRINVLAGKTRNVFVVTNNHFRGQAIVNATEIKQELGQRVVIPSSLRERYPGRWE